MSALDAISALRSRAQIEVENARERFQPVLESKLSSVIGQAYSTIQKVRAVTRAIWNTQTAGAAFILSDITSRIFRIGIAIYEQSKIIQYVAAQARLVSLFSIPFAAYNTLFYANKVALKDDTVNSGIYFAQSLGWFADSTLGVFNALQANPIVAQVAQISIAPLMGVSLGASVISFFWNGYGVYRSGQHLENFDAFINDPNQLEFRELFQIDAQTIADKMKSDKSKTENALKGRIHSKIVSHKLCMLAIAVAGLGLGALLAPGYGVAAAALGALGSVLYLGSMVYELRAKGKLEAEFELSENKWQKQATIIGTLSLIAIPVLFTRNLIES
jgi:hypothetical protein